MDSSGVIRKHFELTSHQSLQLDQLGPIYEDWNSKINLISRKNMDAFYTDHVLHSLGIAKVIEFTQGTTVVDVGTGGGFPGIPLAILFPEVQFHLVDATRKKINVVNAVIQELGLQNATTEHARIEDLDRTFDFVVSRAVTRMAKFYQWVRPLVSKKSTNKIKNGILYLKGGDLKEEMAELNKPYQEFPLSQFFEEPFFETKKVVYVPV